MRSIAPFLIALFAIMGIAAAAVNHVEIITPHDGDVLPVNKVIDIRTLSSSTMGGQTFGRMFINDEPTFVSEWVPTEPGIYTITVEIADNRQFTNSITDEVTITVV